MISDHDTSPSAVTSAAFTPAIRHLAAQEGQAWWIMNSHQVHKLSSADTGGAFSLWFEAFGPGEGPPPHVHGREDETFLVLEGEVTFLGGDVSTVARPGSVVFVPRGQPHTFKNTGQTRAQMAVIVTPGGFERFFSAAAYHCENREQRPAPTEVDIQRLITAAPAHHLTFCPPA